MTNCCLGNYCKSPSNKPTLICGLCRKQVHSVVLGCSIGPACELPPHHHVYQRTLLPFGDPGRLSSSAHICLACSDNATKNIVPLSTTVMALPDLSLTHGNHDNEDDNDTDDAADLLLKKDLASTLSRRRYTLEDKYDVVTKVKDDGTNKKEIAEQFGINKATLNAWLRQKKSIIKQCKGVQERQRFSYQQKHEILSKIKQDKSNKKEIMDAFGIKKHTLNTWLRHRTDIARTSEELPARKANYHSAIWRIHEGVDAFFAENQMRQGKDRINITGYVLGVHANKVKEELLERHANKEIELDEQEVKHLMKFKGSDSWGRKYAKAKGWRGPEFRKGGRDGDDDENPHSSSTILIHHHHHHPMEDTSDNLEQHAAHHSHHHHRPQHGGLGASAIDSTSLNLSNMDNGHKSDESYGYHMYAHNIQQLTASHHLTMAQASSIDPLNNLQHVQMHHQQQLHSSNDNAMSQANMLAQHQQQQALQQQIQQQQLHHQTLQQQQQTMQHHIQQLGEQHSIDHNTLVGHDPSLAMGMSQQQSLQQQSSHLHSDMSSNVPDPRSYNTYV
ncbi:hypothetical protein FisN_18Hh272 [Fistulifera solaris]|uniref:HTH psq-type domain-containing protein n=1 Tax=Fistulifera solaris TaxID=1519565 RepID=A0A1Z5KIT5_FISSO|nr:hypothetical protein FisN_18Hh272 [Fistulifera solaris]|eukprot:GAX26156.1 hypothetical protein FisN_18Hh272 [Fistulifera solaris]